MLSKTSFFSLTLFKKTISRFTPLWAAYFILWFLLLPMPIMTGYLSTGSKASAIADWILSVGVAGGAFIAAVMAVITAMMVYSCFCNSKSAAAMTSLPIRREGLFLSCYGAGLAVMLGINLIIALITGIISVVFAGVPVLVTGSWFLAASLFDIAFFGMATLASALTGNVFGIPIMYTVINFGIICIEGLLTMILYSVSFGLSLNSFPLTDFLTPIVDIIGNVKVINPGFPEIVGFGRIWLWAAVGVVMSGIALMLYKRRHMERASDIAATKFVRIAFRVLAAAAGVAAGYLINLVFFADNYWDMNSTPFGLICLLFWLCLGLGLGWVCGEMLLSKTLKVFTRRNMLRVGISAAALAALMVCIYIDPLGLEKNLPDKEDITEVYLYSYGAEATVAEDENIEAALLVNRSIVENRWLHRSSRQDGHLVRFYYTLESGRTVERAYYINYDSADRVNYFEVFNTEEAVLSRNIPPVEVTPYNIETCYIYSYAYTFDGGSLSNNLELLDSHALDLWQNGIMKDLEEGNLGIVEIGGYGPESVTAEEWENNYKLDINVEFAFNIEEPEFSKDGYSVNYPDTRWFYYYITEDCTHTMAWLETNAPDAIISIDE